jgi:pyruvate/2-oxoacid:ferredoxin oxidoreductase beta subunit
MAIRHKGTAFIDIISPCIAYANREGSTIVVLPLTIRINDENEIPLEKN